LIASWLGAALLAAAALALQAEKAGYCVERGEGEVPLIFPRDEKLVYGVRLELGILGTPRVGSVTIETRVEPVPRESPLLVSEAAAEPPQGERVVIEATAEGSYKLYEVRDVTSTILLPGEWPSVVHRKVQTGSESRRRELLLGRKDGQLVAQYRSDHHCDGCRSRAHFLEPAWPWGKESHCEGCRRGEHRVWKEPRTKPVPEDVIDVMSAIVLARTMVAQGVERASFRMIDKLELWLVDVTAGARERHELPAGSFDAVELRLKTRPPPEDKRREDDFEGLFGIQGEIAMWFDRRAGTPVLVTGRIPAGPLKLNVRVELERRE
jgi:hypothetical protein